MGVEGKGTFPRAPVGDDARGVDAEIEPAQRPYEVAVENPLIFDAFRLVDGVDAGDDFGLGFGEARVNHGFRRRFHRPFFHLHEVGEGVVEVKYDRFYHISIISHSRERGEEGGDKLGGGRSRRRRLGQHLVVAYGAARHVDDDRDAQDRKSLLPRRQASGTTDIPTTSPPSIASAAASASVS